MSRMLRRGDALYAFDLFLQWTTEGREFDLQRLLTEVRNSLVSPRPTASTHSKAAPEQAVDWFLDDRNGDLKLHSAANAFHTSSQVVMVGWIEQWLVDGLSNNRVGSNSAIAATVSCLPDLLASLRHASNVTGLWVHECTRDAVRRVCTQYVSGAASALESGECMLQSCMSWISSSLLPYALPLLFTGEELSAPVRDPGEAGDYNHGQLLMSNCDVGLYVPAATHSCFSSAESRQHVAGDGERRPLSPSARITDILNHARKAMAAAVAINRLAGPFDLVRDYPDSLPILSDAATALALCSDAEAHAIKATFVGQLSDALRVRLLHPGVATSSIVDVYLSLIRTCAVIDPSGIIGTLAAEPVRVYLRHRPDCIRVIITSATEDEGSVLHQELQGRTGKLLVGADSGDSDDTGQFVQPHESVAMVHHTSALLHDALASVLPPAELHSILEHLQASTLPSSSVAEAAFLPGAALPALWSPGLRQEHSVLRALYGAQTSSLHPGQTAVDLLASLVGIFGSADAFVAEYRLLLAERLLSRGQDAGWDLTWEERVLELLKLRFGEASLSTAEVMLKDVVDSKRATAGIGQLLRAGKLDLARTSLHGPTARQHPCLEPLQAGELRAAEMLIVSSHYWQGLPGGRESVLLHPSVQALVDSLTAGYAEVRKPRKAAAFPTLGVLEVDVVLPTAAGPDTTVSVRGTAAQVSVLCYMDGKTSIPLADLCSSLSVPEHTCLRLVQHWAAQHLLALSRQDGRTTVWAAACMPHASDGHLYSGQRDALEAGPADLDPPEAVAMWRSYVSGLLSNLGPQALDRIHSTLKMFASMGDYPYEKQPAETARFLADLVRQDFLELSDGIYKLRT